MVVMELTESEAEIIRVLRQFKPYEAVRISKDKDGRVDSWLEERVTKRLIVGGVVMPLKV